LDWEERRKRTFQRRGIVDSLTKKRSI